MIIYVSYGNVYITNGRKCTIMSLLFRFAFAIMRVFSAVCVCGMRFDDVGKRSMFGHSACVGNTFDVCWGRLQSNQQASRRAFDDTAEMEKAWKTEQSSTDTQ